MKLYCITNGKRVIIGNHSLQGTLSGRQPYNHRESHPLGDPVRETALQSSGITAPGDPVRETALQSSGITAPRVPCQGDSLTIIGNHSPQGTLSGRQPYNHRESQPPGDPVRETALQSSGITAPRGPCQGDSLTIIGNHSPQGTLSGRQPYNNRESQPPGYPVRETALQSSGITAPRGPCQGDSLTIIGNHSPQGTLSGRQPYNHRESQPPGDPVRETALQSSGITAPRGPCQGDSLTVLPSLTDGPAAMAVAYQGQGGLHAPGDVWLMMGEIMTTVHCLQPQHNTTQWYIVDGKIISWVQCYQSHRINSLGPSDAIWRCRSGSTLAQVMACCLTAPSHYLNQCWLIISQGEWHSSEGNFTRDTSATNHWN